MTGSVDAKNIAFGFYVTIKIYGTQLEVARELRSRLI
jgi:hypothetical protein